MTQLTLNLSDQLAQQAEAYAKARGKTLEALVEDALLSLTAGHKLLVTTQSAPKSTPAAVEVSPDILALMGSVVLPEGMTAEQARDEFLAAKYLL